ncbi:MAG: Txe/YoeB family addiction module toxin [Gemmatimonadota bacterium]|nr:Txe/YoeB family addiction module toxin [Gemmatimonadota bacterium]
MMDADCLEDIQWWARNDARVVAKVLTLIEHVMREPFMGIGKPEPLKMLGPNIWSRRITGEHRLVYVVLNDRIHFVQARLHY